MMAELKGVRLAAGAALLAIVLAPGAAEARANIRESVKYYEIAGSTGAELMVQMNRRGPRHGFLKRALAQTQFKPKFDGDIVYRNGKCVASGVDLRMNITYVYPKPVGPMPGDLKRRWAAFQADNVRHEKRHGAIAKDMMAKLDRYLRGFRVADRSNCRVALRQLNRDVERIIDQAVKAQNEFDRIEHRSKGPVEKSIRLLVGLK